MSVFSSVGADALTAILKSMRPIDVIKLCWLTSSGICNKARWTILLSHHFNLKQNDIPENVSEQKLLFYSLTMDHYSPFYVGVGKKEMRTFVTPSGKIIEGPSIPKVFRLLGFENNKEIRAENSSDAGIWNRFRGSLVAEAINHPLDETDFIYIIQEPWEGIDPIPNPKGETVWALSHRNPFIPANVPTDINFWSSEPDTGERTDRGFKRQLDMAGGNLQKYRAHRVGADFAADSCIHLAAHDIDDGDYITEEVARKYDWIFPFSREHIYEYLLKHGYYVVSPNEIIQVDQVAFSALR